MNGASVAAPSGFGPYGPSPKRRSLMLRSDCDG